MYAAANVVLFWPCESLPSIITRAAQPVEILVSSTVKDLVAGSGITFTDRGTHIFKGLPEEWRLFTPDVPAASAPAS
jgi:hypothetical protein